MQPFYTSVTLKKNIITEFWIDEDGKRKKTTSKFRPTLALATSENQNNANSGSDLQNIFGEPLKIKEFDSCMEMYGWKKENGKYTNIYNDIGPTYEYISKKYPDNLAPDFTKLKIFNIDIEVISDKGFPFPDVAEYPITSITIQDYYKNQYYVFAFKEYTPKSKNVRYIQCNDEFDLCAKFLAFFKKARPDIITGFYTEGFDIPYIVNRLKQVLPKGEYYKLSPVEEIRPFNIDGKQVGYNIIGIAHLDFKKIYKLMNLKKLEAYSLEVIAQEELGEGKIDFRDLGFNNHYEFYHGDFEKFIDYNIRDVEVVAKINKKKRFIEIVLAQAYMAKINIEDALGSVKPWDVYVYNENKKRGILASPKANKPPQEFPGGFVLEPRPGIHEWLLVADIASSYPNNIISANISPETHVDSSKLPLELLDIQLKIKKEFWGTKERVSTGFIDIDNISHITELLKKYNLCLSPNGEFFRSDRFGIFPEIVSKVYQGRKDEKKKMKGYWNEMNKKKEELKLLEEELASLE